MIDDDRHGTGDETVSRLVDPAFRHWLNDNTYTASFNAGEYKDAKRWRWGFIDGLMNEEAGSDEPAYLAGRLCGRDQDPRFR